MRALLLLIALTRVASAEVPRVSVFAGAGLRMSTGYEAFLAGDTPSAPGLEAMVGFHVTPALAIGLRAGISRHTGHDEESGHITSDQSDTSLVPLDLAIAAAYSEGRFAVTPWIGVHFTRRHTSATNCYIQHVVTPECSDTEVRSWSTDFVSYGLTASIDAYRHGEHRVAVFMTVQAYPHDASLEDGSGRLVTYAAITLGLAYRR